MLYVSFPTPREKLKSFKAWAWFFIAGINLIGRFLKLVGPQTKKTLQPRPPPQKKKPNNLPTNQQKHPVERFVIMATERLRYKRSHA